MKGFEREECPRCGSEIKEENLGNSHCKYCLNELYDMMEDQE